MATQLSDKYLEQVERRLRVATAGPWISFVEGRDHTSGSNFIRTSGDDIELLGGSVANQDFIAHARQDVPLLLAEVRQLRERLSLLVG
jgi:hypothetical protein